MSFFEICHNLNLADLPVPSPLSSSGVAAANMLNLPGVSAVSLSPPNLTSDAPALYADSYSNTSGNTKYNNPNSGSPSTPLQSVSNSQNVGMVSCFFFVNFNT